MKPRIPFFCEGCPHKSTYTDLMEVIETKKVIINGDIGCYEMAGFGNYNNENKMRDLIDTLYVMGSGISISEGMFHAGYKYKIIALAGDSTFFHSCIPGLINAFQNRANILYLILDNRCTAMTGQQLNPSSFLEIENIVKSIGIKNVKTINSYDSKNLKKSMKDYLNNNELSVIISKGECIKLRLKRLK